MESVLLLSVSSRSLILTQEDMRSRHAPASTNSTVAIAPCLLHGDRLKSYLCEAASLRCLSAVREETNTASFILRSHVNSLHPNVTFVGSEEAAQSVRCFPCPEIWKPCEKYVPCGGTHLSSQHWGGGNKTGDPWGVTGQPT